MHISKLKDVNKLHQQLLNVKEAIKDVENYDLNCNKYSAITMAVQKAGEEYTSAYSAKPTPCQKTIYTLEISNTKILELLYKEKTNIQETLYLLGIKL